MAKDYIGYKAITDAALRGVVREALKRVEKQGLIGSHHFRITFRTRFPGVEIPEFLLEQYPDEMMIIMQHQYSGLKVKDERFEVTLSFRKIPATLSVPFAALTAFVDPGVQFGLQFKETEEGGSGPQETPSAQPTQLAAPQKPKLQAEPEKPENADAEKPAAAPGEVVSLDAFRKK
jgi:hypothetical protein